MTSCEVPGVLPELLRSFLMQYVQHCAREEVDAHPRVTQAVLSVFRDAEKQNIPDLDDYLCKSGVCLALDNAGLGIAQLHALIAALPFLPMRVLSLANCILGDTALRALCRSITISTPVWPSMAVTTATGVVGGGARLGYSVLLKQLSLGGTGLVDVGCLASVLQCAPRLQRLDLSYNRIGTHAASLALLCAAAQTHPALEELDLSSNLLSGARSERTVAVLAELVVCCGRPGGRLRRLDLQDNNLGLYYYHCCPDLTMVERRAAEQRAGEPTTSVFGAFPLLDALFLNNTIEALCVRANDLPEGIVDWIEAKTAVNARAKRDVLFSQRRLTETIETAKLECLAALHAEAESEGEEAASKTISSTGTHRVDMVTAQRIVLAALDKVEQGVRSNVVVNASAA